jgi:hypothetical protein
VNCGPGHLQGTYISAYIGFNIQLKVAPLLFEVSRQFNARYNANLVPITAHFLQLTLCELWSRPYTKYLQIRIFRLQYSTVGICAAIVDITSIQRVILQIWCQMQCTSPSFLYVNSGPAHIQSIYSSAYICFNIRWNASALVLEIIGHFEARYTANLEANMALIIRFTLCVLWYRTYTM